MEVFRYAAFSADPRGGNPAGVVLDATGATDAAMQAAALEVGFSETAFLFPRPSAPEADSFDIRYFSPLAEVPFCGHATIATAVALGERNGTGTITFHTRSGVVGISTSRRPDGQIEARMTSVPTRVVEIDPDGLAELLAALRWSDSDLDPALPPRVAYAGAWHPIIAADSRDRLAHLDYDFAALGALMSAGGWTTVNLIWRESATVFHARNPFPPGGVVEDPATGAAAAALGGYLRELRLVQLPARLTVEQGADMGRPGLLTVEITDDPDAGIRVTGTAVALD
jgi:PhzF family phenazine biosynthesis protein